MAKESKELPRVPSQAGWTSILGAVRQPITFFALALLVMSALAGGAFVALRWESDGQQLRVIVLTVAAVCVLAILVVAVLAIWWRGALMGTDMGTDRLSGSLAESLAEAVVDALHGSVANWDNPEDQSTAWATLIICIERRPPQEDRPAGEFRKFLARGIHFRVMKKSPPALRARIKGDLVEMRREVLQSAN